MKTYKNSFPTLARVGLFILEGYYNNLSYERL